MRRHRRYALTDSPAKLTARSEFTTVRTPCPSAPASPACTANPIATTSNVIMFTSGLFFIARTLRADPWEFASLSRLSCPDDPPRASAYPRPARPGVPFLPVLSQTDVVNLRWRDAVPRGRHASNEDGPRLDPRSDLRGLLTALVVLLGLASSFARWATSTPLLGANLGSAAHVTLVTAFFAALAVVSYVVSWQGYRHLAKWSQDRRARQRGQR